MAMLMNGEIMLLPLIVDSLTLEKEKERKQHQWQKNQNKRLRNQKLSTLPTFQSDKPYQVIFINYMTAYFVLLQLIERADKTFYFAMDTETDDISKQPALIQIQLIHLKNETFDDEKQQQEETIIIIFEMCQLPSMTSVIYPRIQQLINTIFHHSKTFLTWGNGTDELFKFTIYSLFKCVPIACLHFINVQARFKNWYNNTYKHNSHCRMVTLFHNDITDNPICDCSHRPYKNTSDTWSLQLAISTIFNQFLDKSITRNNWSQALDIRLYQNIQIGVPNYNVKSCLTDEQEQIRLKLVKYIIDDCLALTKLAFTIGKYLVSVTYQYINIILLPS